MCRTEGWPSVSVCVVVMSLWDLESGCGGEGNWVEVGLVNCMCGGRVDQESLLVVVV